MKKLIFYLVGAIFLFVSCQSDESVFEDAAKSDNADMFQKTIVFQSYEGVIATPPGGGCTYVVPDAGIPLQFIQTGEGYANRIRNYTFINTACIGEFGLEDFEGVITAENGDEIQYGLDNIVCDGDVPFPPCPGEYATFTYNITGGTGEFEGASGTIEIRGIFVPVGEFEAKGKAVIMLDKNKRD
jgi:hypothetical protein